VRGKEEDKKHVSKKDGKLRREKKKSCIDNVDGT
jgi:hypothetical protein